MKEKGIQIICIIGVVVSLLIILIGVNKIAGPVWINYVDDQGKSNRILRSGTVNKKEVEIEIEQYFGHDKSYIGIPDENMVTIVRCYMEDQHSISVKNAQVNIKSKNNHLSPMSVSIDYLSREKDDVKNVPLDSLKNISIDEFASLHFNFVPLPSSETDATLDVLIEIVDGKGNTIKVQDRIPIKRQERRESFLKSVINT